MADYIKRQDAIDAFCGDCSWGRPERPYVRPCAAPCDEYKRLLAIQAADTVEVVRCKDCIHRITDEETGIRWCIANGGIRDDDFFCADGRRREDATD